MQHEQKKTNELEEQYTILLKVHIHDLCTRMSKSKKPYFFPFDKCINIENLTVEIGAGAGNDNILLPLNRDNVKILDELIENGKTQTPSEVSETLKQYVEFRRELGHFQQPTSPNIALQEILDLLVFVLTHSLEIFKNTPDEYSQYIESDENVVKQCCAISENSLPKNIN